MKKKVILFACCFLLMAGSIIGQTISKRTQDFARKYLWDIGYFNHSSFKTFESIKTLISIAFLGSQQFKYFKINIYLVGADISHYKTLVLIERVSKGSSDYAVIGVSHNMNEVKTMRQFFIKYKFNQNIRNICYEILLDNNIYSNYLIPDMLKEDSLFSFH